MPGDRVKYTECNEDQSHEVYAITGTVMGVANQEDHQNAWLDSPWESLRVQWTEPPAVAGGEPSISEAPSNPWTLLRIAGGPRGDRHVRPALAGVGGGGGGGVGGVGGEAAAAPRAKERAKNRERFRSIADDEEAQLAPPLARALVKQVTCPPPLVCSIVGAIEGCVTHRLPL